MRPALSSRAGLSCLLLMGFSLELVVPVALEPDHYLEHGPSAQTAAEERVSLHGEDGDHHHDTARLELGEKSRHPRCGLCARFGKTQALLIKQLGLADTLGKRSVAPVEGAFLNARRGRGPQQPRAPPRV